MIEMVQILEPGQEMALRRAAFATLEVGDMFRFYRGAIPVHAVCCELEGDAVWAVVLDREMRMRMAIDSSTLLVRHDIHLDELHCLTVYRDA